MAIDYKALFERLTKRYGGATAEAMEGILCPVLIPDPVPGQGDF